MDTEHEETLSTNMEQAAATCTSRCEIRLKFCIQSTSMETTVRNTDQTVPLNSLQGYTCARN